MFHRPRLACAGLAALCLLGTAPSSIHAAVGGVWWTEGRARPHIDLIASEPANGDTVATGVERVRLVFSGTVEEALSEIRLAGPAGLVLSLDVASDPTTDRALVAGLPELAAGAYRVSWRTVSVDGHAATGSFVFYVRSADAVGSEQVGGEPSGSEPSEPGGPTEQAEPPPAEDEPLGVGVPPSLALSRGAAVAALLALGGLLAMIVWVVPVRPRRAVRLAYLLSLLVPLLLTAHLFLWLLSVSPGNALDPEKIPALLGTRAGGLELLRLGLTVAALATLTFGRHLTSAALLTLLAVLVSGATGHALSTDPWVSVPAKALHLVATQLWLGGLLYLIVEATDSVEYRTAAARISRIAFLAVLVIAATGIMQTLAALPTPAAVLTSTYGRLVLAKSAGLGVLVLFGYRNQFRLLPALEEEGAAARLRGSVMWETFVMALVFIVAALLAYVPPT